MSISRLQGTSYHFFDLAEAFLDLVRIERTSPSNVLYSCDEIALSREYLGLECDYGALEIRWRFSVAALAVLSRALAILVDLNGF